MSQHSSRLAKGADNSGRFEETPSEVFLAA